LKAPAATRSPATRRAAPHRGRPQARRRRLDDRSSQIARGVVIAERPPLISALAPMPSSPAPAVTSTGIQIDAPAPKVSTVVTIAATTTRVVVM